MGLLDKIFGPRLKKSEKSAASAYFKTMTAYNPRFITWSGALYESELVRAAIDAKARHASKLAVEIVGTAKPKLQHRLRLGPNQWQTWSQFLYRTKTVLEMQNNAFIAPVWDEYGEMTGIYCLPPAEVTLREYGGETYYAFRFANGESAALETRLCGHVLKHQYQQDFFGESNDALSPTMELINLQDQAIGEAVRSSATYRFMARVTNFAFSEDLKAEQDNFNELNSGGKRGGLALLFPNTYDNIQQITTKPYVVEKEQMDLINENVYDYFGVNKKILQNAANGDDWSSFYEGDTEVFAIQLSEVLTKMLFSVTERERGARIMLTANRLQYMTNADKLAVSAQMADRGLMTRDEIRQIWNLPPLPDGIGASLPIRGEYYDLKQEVKNGEENGA